MSERVELTPYTWVRDWRKHLPDEVLHSMGLCNYHPYQQEQDVLMAHAMDADGIFWRVSEGLRDNILDICRAAQDRLIAHDIDWTADWVLEECKRRKGKLVRVSNGIHEMQRPPDAMYWSVDKY